MAVGKMNNRHWNKQKSNIGTNKEQIFEQIGIKYWDKYWDKYWNKYGDK